MKQQGHSLHDMVSGQLRSTFLTRPSPYPAASRSLLFSEQISPFCTNHATDEHRGHLDIHGSQFSAPVSEVRFHPQTMGSHMALRVSAIFTHCHLPSGRFPVFISCHRLSQLHGLCTGGWTWSTEEL
jgi:hypothetical protein